MEYDIITCNPYTHYKSGAKCDIWWHCDDQIDDDNNWDAILFAYACGYSD